MGGLVGLVVEVLSIQYPEDCELFSVSSSSGPDCRLFVPPHLNGVWQEKLKFVLKAHR